MSVTCKLTNRMSLALTPWLCMARSIVAIIVLISWSNVEDVSPIVSDETMKWSMAEQGGGGGGGGRVVGDVLIFSIVDTGLTVWSNVL